MQAQATWDHYNYYFNVKVGDSYRYFDQRSTNYVWCHNDFHGGANQQWAIMPTFVKSDNGVLSYSNEFIIASRYDGDVLDIKSDNTVFCNSSFHGGPNQIFTFIPHTAGVYSISSPRNPNMVLDKSSNNNNHVYFRNYHGLANQQFSLLTSDQFQNAISPLQSIVRIQPPPPPAPGSLHESVITETAKVFKSETLVPYAMVKNDGPIAIQINRTPYYRLVRYQYYRLPEGIDTDIIYMPGEGFQKTVTTKTGMKSTSVTEVSSKLNVSFTSSGEVAGKMDEHLSYKTTQSVSTAMELAEKNVSTFEETNEIIVQTIYEFNATQPVRLVTYQLTDYYEMYRLDRTLLMSWEVSTAQAHRVQYPAEEDYNGGRVGKGESFTLVDGSVIPITVIQKTAAQARTADANEALTTSRDESAGTFQLSVSPNPTTGTAKLTYNSLSGEKQIVVSIFSQDGFLRKKEELVFSSTGNDIDISNLPSGLYFVKVVAGQHRGTLRLVKK
jgi:hypothetical protein